MIVSGAAVVPTCTAVKDPSIRQPIEGNCCVTQHVEVRGLGGVGVLMLVVVVKQSTFICTAFCHIQRHLNAFHDPSGRRARVSCKVKLLQYRCRYIKINNLSTQGTKGLASSCHLFSGRRPDSEQNAKTHCRIDGQTRRFLKKIITD